MKKVLIISYYWPPTGGGGVMRWLKMSKYLPETGWQPIVYSPSNPDPSVLDESLRSQIHTQTIELKQPIWEPYDLYRSLTGKKKGEKFKAGFISEASTGSFKNKLSVFLRGNLLIPDPRCFWINPSVKYLKKYLIENPVDLIISTGPPHSMHLIALKLKKYIDTPWIADFRDPWTDIDFYHKLRLTRFADKLHHRLEAKVLKIADKVVTVSPAWAQDLEEKSGRSVDVIHNGYDPADYDFEKVERDAKFSITHYGAFNQDRNPALFWEVLSELKKDNNAFASKLQIKLIGQTDQSVIDNIVSAGLEDNLLVIGQLPHTEGLSLLKKSQVLLLPINDTPNAKGILPGKMYEYMALERPIFAIGPEDADFSRIISESKSGSVVGFEDKVKMKANILSYFEMYHHGNLELKQSTYTNFSRQVLAHKYMKLI